MGHEKRVTYSKAVRSYISKFDKDGDLIYTDDKRMFFENEIKVANKALPTVLIPGISGCDVTLIFAQMDNSDAEINSLRILEHNIIHRKSTGGS